MKEREKPAGTIRTAYDLDNEPYLFEASGAEVAKRFVDIFNADNDGRLLVLPCKVGDTVYTIWNKRANQITVSMNQYGGECTQIGSVKNLTVGNFSGKGGWVD